MRYAVLISPGLYDTLKTKANSKTAKHQRVYLIVLLPHGF